MKIKHQLQGGIAVIVSIAIVSLALATMINWVSIQRLETRVAVYRDLTIEEIKDQKIITMDLSDKLDEQQIMNASFNGRIHANFKATNDNQEQIINNIVEIDSVNHENCDSRINELIKEVEYLRKKVE